MEIKPKIKEWYRGKPVPIRLMIGGKILETGQNKYVQSAPAKLISIIAKTFIVLRDFITREWKWFIPTSIAAAALLLAFTKK